MNRNERRRLARTVPQTINQPRIASAIDEGLHSAFMKHQAGDLRTAETTYREILVKNPNHPDATRLLGELLIDTGRAALAIPPLRILAAAHPRNFSVQYSLGNAYRMAGHPIDAITSYRAAIAANPGFSGAHHGLGASLAVSGQYAAAVVSFAELTRLNPKWPVGWHEYGMALAAIGKLDAAKAALEHALALDPGLAETRRHLLALRDHAAPDDIAGLQAILANANLPPAARIEYGFALGKLLDTAGRFDEAFAQFASANQRLRETQAAQGQRFDRARLTADINKLIAAFPAASFPASAKPDASQLPVFIVGMPRSGTSLVEQIAASHGQVFGAGELKAIGAIAGKLGWAPSARWSEPEMREQAAAHLADLGYRGGGALRVIDKMPDNIFQLGLIARLHPQARIIFCERNPVDTCFSCYTQRFAEPHGFDTDLADCGFRHREIDRLTRHWQQVLPLPMLRLSYEALVADPASEARKLIDFLGLQWDPACLEFHRTERVVTTASWAQVRQPLYRHAVGRAANYTHHLAPLLDALG